MTSAGTLQLNAGGYGYGLRISQTCDFNHIVAHSGGLPGFGSLMQWLPEYGVGVIAFGNLTYTGGGAVANAFELLAKTGGLQPRVPQPSDALAEARDAVSRLIVKWDDREADRVAAMNLFLDRSKDRRRREIEDLKAKVGACTAPKSFDSVENALRGAVDDEVRTRRLARVDHAGADDPSTRAVSGCPRRAASGGVCPERRVQDVG